MPKTKSHKALLKRIKITARGKVKFNKAGASHLLSNKTGLACQRRRGFTYAKRGDIKRLEAMLHRPLTAVDA